MTENEFERMKEEYGSRLDRDSHIHAYRLLGNLKVILQRNILEDAVNQRVALDTITRVDTYLRAQAKFSFYNESIADLLSDLWRQSDNILAASNLAKIKNVRFLTSDFVDMTELHLFIGGMKRLNDELGSLQDFYINRLLDQGAQEFQQLSDVSNARWGELDKFLENAKSYSDAAAKAASETESALKEAVLHQNSRSFFDQAKRFEISFFIISALSLCLFGALIITAICFIHFDQMYAYRPLPDSVWQFLERHASKILLSVVLVYGLFSLLRLAFSAWHNFVVTSHRANALDAALKLRDGLSEKEKDVLFLRAAEAIFSHQDTGVHKTSTPWTGAFSKSE